MTCIYSTAANAPASGGPSCRRPPTQGSLSETMISFEAIVIELESERPDQLAVFYERLFGLNRAAESAGSVRLARPGLQVHIRLALDADEPRDVSFGVLVGPDADIAALREEAIAAGAVVLSESKRDGGHALTCQDPSGNEFTISRLVAAEAGSQQSLVPVTADGPRDAAPATPATPETPLPATRQAPTQGGITRRAVDMLLDKERIAKMQETIAGLHQAFAPDDPAAVLDEMRAKIPASAIDQAAAEADAIMRAKEREAAAVDLLAQYKRQVTGGVEAPPPEPSAPAPTNVQPQNSQPAASPAPADDDTVGIRPKPRTLGRADEKDD